jgi:ribosomal protein S18 acetylase RimI-like enzyme
MVDGMAGTPGVVVQKLTGAHREQVVRHLLRLAPDDRRLRFGAPMRDSSIAAYVAGIDFAKDQAFGILSSDLELWGMAHLALERDGETAELGLSVDRAARNQGYGRALLERAVLHATNRGYRALFMHCLAENETMLSLARKVGLSVVITSGEADGRLSLGEPTQAGALREAIQDQFALVDALLKHQYALLARPRSLEQA